MKERSPLTPLQKGGKETNINSHSVQQIFLSKKIQNSLKVPLFKGDLGGSIAESPQTETIAVLETQIDDLSPQVLGYVMDELFKVGALDVFTQAIGMKKSRVGILMTVICQQEHIATCETILLRETTTLGIRHHLQERTILPRAIYEVQTLYGSARVKVAKREDLITVQPEYDDCVQLARQHQVPLWQVQAQVRSAGEQLIAAIPNLFH